MHVSFGLPRHHLRQSFTGGLAVDDRRRYTAFNHSCFWKYKGCRVPHPLMTLSTSQSRGDPRTLTFDAGLCIFQKRLEMAALFGVGVVRGFIASLAFCLLPSRAGGRVMS